MSKEWEEIKILINNYKSYEGRHCASTAISEVSMYYNNDLTEEMVFGLGSGLDFTYIYYYLADHSRYIFTRNPVFENSVLSNLGVNSKWYHGNKLELNFIKSFLDKGIPVLLWTDPACLHFFKTTTPSFAAHTLVLIGYDDKGFYISDSISEKILYTSYSEIEYAASVPKPPFYKKNVFLPIKEFTVKNLDEHVKQSLKYNAQHMLTVNPYRGVGAIKRITDEIREWKNITNCFDLCLDAYRSMELIGTGGSGFRNIYTDFLIEVEGKLLISSKHQFSTKMNHISKLYKNLSKSFYLAGVKKNNSYLKKIESILIEIHKKETAFWTEVSSIE